MTYVDGFVFTVPRKKLAAYKKMAQFGAKMWKKHGALAYKECQGDDMRSQTGRTFPQLAKPAKGEVVFFSYIVFKSRAHRDAVNKKVMSDPAMGDGPTDMPFDFKKMAYGGFKTIVEF